MSRDSITYEPEFGRRAGLNDPISQAPNYRGDLGYFRGVDNSRPAGLLSYPDSDGNPLPRYKDDDFAYAYQSEKKVDPSAVPKPAGITYRPDGGGNPLPTYMDDTSFSPRDTKRVDPSMTLRAAGINIPARAGRNPLKWMYDEEGNYRNESPLNYRNVKMPNGYAQSSGKTADKIRVSDIKSIDLVVTLNDNSRVVISNAAFKPL